VCIIGWCAVEIADISKQLAFRAEEPSRGAAELIERARKWVNNRRRIDPGYPGSDERWIAQTISSELIKAVVWGEGDLLRPLGTALIQLTGFEVVLVQGTSDGVPLAITELLIRPESLHTDCLALGLLVQNPSSQPALLH
jgi:hypothetical protein